MSDVIKLPPERAEQLRMLAKKLDMTIADCIAMFIREQIAKSVLPDTVPGIIIERKGESIALDTGSFKRDMTAGLAQAYAAQVRGMLDPIKTPAPGNPFLTSAKLDVAKRGTGLKLIDRSTGAEKTLAPSVAFDFARVLQQASE
jgi:hypothetical protein